VVEGSAAGADCTEKEEVVDWKEDTRRSRAREGGVKSSGAFARESRWFRGGGCTAVEKRWLARGLLKLSWLGRRVGTLCGGNVEEGWGPIEYLDEAGFEATDGGRERYRVGAH